MDISSFQQLLSEGKSPVGLHFPCMLDSTVTGDVISCKDPRSVAAQFPQAKLIRAQNVVRPIGDTTLFATSGVQYLETLEKRTDILPREVWLICQPVIRSQFIDDVGPGVATSFVNCSMVHPDAGHRDFVDTIRQLILMSIALGAKVDDLGITYEEKPAQWGEKSFTQKMLTLYNRDVELGEVVHMLDFPFGREGRKENIVECGFGVERMHWGISPSRPSECIVILQTVDAMRSMVLIALEGIQPSNTNHGYRSRVFSKRYVASNAEAKMNFRDLVREQYEYWMTWGAVSQKSEQEVFDVLSKECQRNYNALFLKVLKEEHQCPIGVDINIPSSQFLARLKNSVPHHLIPLVASALGEFPGK